MTSKASLTQFDNTSRFQSFQETEMSSRSEDRGSTRSYEVIENRQSFLGSVVSKVKDAVPSLLLPTIGLWAASYIPTASAGLSALFVCPLCIAPGPQQPVCIAACLAALGSPV